MSSGMDRRPHPVRSVSPSGSRQWFYSPSGLPNSREQVREHMDIFESGDVKHEDGNDGGKTKRRRSLKKKFPRLRTNKKAKRRRQNARLKKILLPKNAVRALHDFQTRIKFTTEEQKNTHTQTMFSAKVEIDAKTYTGQGMSKTMAKENAAENALKGLFLQKLSDASIGNPASSGSNSGVGECALPEDDMPWATLASFAVHKLLAEWHSQGTVMPITKSNGPPSQPAKATAQAPMKQIRGNPIVIHPVVLLCRKKPGIKFKELSQEGVRPNLVFTFCVTVDDVTYFGKGKNKKEAKKEAAKAALAGIYKINFD